MEGPYFREICDQLAGLLGSMPAQSRRRQPRTFAGRSERQVSVAAAAWRLPWRFLIYDRGSGSLISAHAVTLLHNGLRDFIGQQARDNSRSALRDLPIGCSDNRIPPAPPDKLLCALTRKSAVCTPRLTASI
mgnify:CR=1 FL=1